jgi:hypothetical protein
MPLTDVDPPTAPGFGAGRSVSIDQYRASSRLGASLANGAIPAGRICVFAAKATLSPRGGAPWEVAGAR